MIKTFPQNIRQGDYGKRKYLMHTVSQSAQKIAQLQIKNGIVSNTVRLAVSRW